MVLFVVIAMKTPNLANEQWFLLHNTAPLLTTLIIQRFIFKKGLLRSGTLPLNRFGSGWFLPLTEVKNEDEGESILYHPKECDRSSQGHKF
jgi:hypothetical protein